jgi:hypothetical protein
MKISKLLASAFALSLLFNISCRNDDPFEDELPKGDYENGIIISNEGGFTTPTASATFLSNDLSTQTDNIFGKNNNEEKLGNVFQTIGFKGDLAYLVMNIPNKVEIVNRYTFKKISAITSNLESPRYIAFTGTNTYITNNNFGDVKKVNIYDTSNNFVKSIAFDRYAEKITASNGFIYVQTDGSKYDANYNELPTGHTISRINPATNTTDKIITLDDNLIIKDMISDGQFVYVLTSDTTKSNIYKITSSTGIAQQIPLTTAPDAAKLAIDQTKLYYITTSKKIFNLTGNTSTELFTATANNLYGFNVIDGSFFIADPTFSGDSKVRIYNLTGNLVKTLTTGIGTNGFYKN